jgi:DNA-binding NtrC family response regulator
MSTIAIDHSTSKLSAGRMSLDGISLLLVDDDQLLLESTQLWLQELGMCVRVASSPQQATEALARDVFDVVLCDLRMEHGSGLDVLQAAKSLQVTSCCIAMSGFATHREEVNALQAGAVCMLRKPWTDAQLIDELQRRIREKRLVERERRVAKLIAEVEQQSLTPVRSRSGHWLQSLGWLGNSSALQEIIETIDTIATSNVSVLILGENGTGKSKLARCIHTRSARRTGPFVEVACGAIAEQLLESELFGHIAGAFTGANCDRAGKIQASNNGTLFLDEIGTASKGMQVKLLRVLQEKSFEPVGSHQTHHVDNRMIFATNERLEQAVAEGRFREDLYYRINVVPILIPPLRKRLDDLPDLISHFLHEANAMFGKHVTGVPVLSVSSQAMDRLRDYRWPGNIRELENLIHRAVMMSSGESITAHTIEKILGVSRQLDVTHSESQSSTAVHHPQTNLRKAENPVGWSENYRDLDEALAGPERQILVEALARYEWNRNTTAERLGINRTTLYKKMKRLGITEVS